MGGGHGLPPLLRVCVHAPRPRLPCLPPRVLLFSTMTRLLDLLEDYLRWRALPDTLGGGAMQYLRIDGSTSLEQRWF